MGLLRSGDKLHRSHPDLLSDLPDGGRALPSKRHESSKPTGSDRSNVPKSFHTLQRIHWRWPDNEQMEFESARSSTEGVLRVKLDFLTFFVSAFATYRITVLISRDVGPWGICKKLREHSKLLKCPYCTSVYVGSLTALVLWISGFVMPFGMWCILSLAFAGATIVLDRCFSADYQP